MNTTRIEEAIAFALKAHASQTRKGEETPYIVHPIAVALVLAQNGFSDDVIIGGILHDTVEDTSATHEDIRALFGEDVWKLVSSVTHDGSLSWREKKEAYIEGVRASSDDAKAIATADKIANAQSLIASHTSYGSDVWKRFSATREDKLWFEHAMLAMLQDSWSHPLITEYQKQVALLDRLV